MVKRQRHFQIVWVEKIPESFKKILKDHYTNYFKISTACLFWWTILYSDEQIKVL